MIDVIQKIGNSFVHHGKHSNRAYLMKLDARDAHAMPEKLLQLACDKGYTKIIAKIPKQHLAWFEENGFIAEAYVAGYFNGKADGYFVSCYPDEKRRRDPSHELCTEILNIARRRRCNPTQTKLPPGCICRKMTQDDAPLMAALYTKVFQTYPFPIHDADYLSQTMRENVIYFGVLKGDEPIGLSSIERDENNSAAEMTDFAVLPDHRGSGIAYHLLEQMERTILSLEIKTMFTIARARSTGMNVTFAKNGYSFAGTLINNTNIAGRIESMNVWYKRAAASFLPFVKAFD